MESASYITHQLQIKEDFHPAPAAGTTTMAADHYMAPHISQARAMPDYSFWLDAETPLVATGDPRAGSQILAGNPDPAHILPLDQPFSVETEQFVGIELMQIKGLGAQAAGSCKWLSRTTFQGRFKRLVPAEDLWVGQFNWNKQRLPASFQKLVLTSAGKVFSSTCRVKYEYPCQPGDPHEGVYFMNPLLAMAKVVHVCPPGEVPPSLFDVPEDSRALGTHLQDRKGQPLSPSARQKYYDRPANLAAQTLDDVNTFTFVISQNVLDFAAYKLTLGGWLNLDLCSLLNGQPLQMMLYNVREHQLVLGVLMWHKHLNFRDGYNSSSHHASSSASSLLAGGSSIAGSSDRMCGGVGSSGGSTGSTLSLQESSSSGSSLPLQDSSSGNSSLQMQDSSSLDSSSSSVRAANCSDAASSSSQPEHPHEVGSSNSSCDADECCSCSDYGSACSDQFDVWSDADLQTSLAVSPLASPRPATTEAAQPLRPAAEAAAAAATPEPGLLQPPKQQQQQLPLVVAQQEHKQAKLKVTATIRSLWAKHIKRSSSSTARRSPTTL